MMTSAPSPALSGRHLLILADGDVDIDQLRKLGFPQITIGRRHPDGSFDHRIDLTFDLVIAALTHLDPSAVRAVVDFALPRLAADAVLQFHRGSATRSADLALIRASLPDLTVNVVPMPEPFNRKTIEVRRSTSRRGWRPLPRARSDQGSRRLPHSRPL